MAALDLVEITMNGSKTQETVFMVPAHSETP